MKDAYTVSYAPQALEDLKGIYAYIAFELQASVTGKKLVNQKKTSPYLSYYFLSAQVLSLYFIGRL